VEGYQSIMYDGLKDYLGEDFKNHLKGICPFCRKYSIRKAICERCGVAFPMLADNTKMYCKKSDWTNLTRNT